MFVHAASQSVLLKVPDPLMIRDLLPKSRLIDHADYNIAFQHTLAATKVMRNIGFDVPAPILSQYHFPGKYTPYEHQKKMAEFCTIHRRCYNLSEPGTCKTAATLWAADYLMNAGLVRKVLICCPLSVVETTWMHDLFDTLMHRKGVIVHGTKKVAALGHDVDFYVMNHDGVKNGEIAKIIRTNPDIDLVVVDEGDEFRNAGTEKYKSLAKVIRPDMRLWWLTGTPCPNAPTDAWAQARIVSPERVPQFFGSFKRMTMTQVSTFKWVAKPEAFKIAFDAMQPAIRFKKSECLDLPPVVTLNRQAEMTKEQRSKFEEMRKTMATEISNARSTGVPITAVNAADKLTKLRQILCGSVKDPETDTYFDLPHGPRLAVTLECIQSASAKVYIVVPFKGIIKTLARELGKHYTVGVLNGDISARARAETIRQFKTTPNPHILLCHPKVTSHGLNFTEADTLILYAPIYSNSQFQQIIERFNRPGQTRKMTIYRIAAHPIEWEIYKQVDNKGITQDNILRLYNQAVSPDEQ
jgi:hypothetical protein